MTSAPDYASAQPAMPDPGPNTRQSWQDIRYSSFDGLSLHARYYPARETTGARPLLCLPGLTRNAKDFHVLAEAFSLIAPECHDVYALDYRGRGQSDYDPQAQYTPFIEMLDVLDFLTVMGLENVAIIGTSRGGIIAMMMAAMRPTVLGPVILNDIGPVMETTGLARILGYVGKTPFPNDWQEAAILMRQMNGHFFTAIKDDQWDGFARRWYNVEDGLPAQYFDPKLALTLGKIDISHKIPAMWPQFKALRRVPVLVIRGENSDFLSAETVIRMGAVHPALKTFVVPEQGHAPLLEDNDTLEAINAFLLEGDQP